MIYVLFDVEKYVRVSSSYTKYNILFVRVCNQIYFPQRDKKESYCIGFEKLVT